MGLPARGEVWWCELPRSPGARLRSCPEMLPFLDFDGHSLGPCTTTIRQLRSEVILEPAEDPIPRRSAVNLDSVESVSVAVLVSRLGRLADFRMREICAALAVAVDCSAKAAQQSNASFAAPEVANRGTR
jgi:mRNA interferase MazF